MITSPHNEQLKTIRKLHEKKHRERTRLFLAEGEDLVAAAEAAGWPAEGVLVAGRDVEPELLAGVSSLGSGTRAIGIYPQRFSEPGGTLSAYLEGVADPGNLGTVIRSAHAFADGPVVLGPGCADPFSPKAVRASMGSIFARPPARGSFAELEGTTLALTGSARLPLGDVDPEPPLVVCLGSERDGLPDEVVSAASVEARIPMRGDGPDSINVAMAATVALHELANRMAGHA